MIAVPRRTFIAASLAGVAALWLPVGRSDARKVRCRRWRPLTPWSVMAGWPRIVHDIRPVPRWVCRKRRD